MLIKAFEENGQGLSSSGAERKSSNVKRNNTETPPACAGSAAAYLQQCSRRYRTYPADEAVRIHRTSLFSSRVTLCAGDLSVNASRYAATASRRSGRHTRFSSNPGWRCRHASVGRQLTANRRSSYWSWRLIGFKIQRRQQRRDIGIMPHQHGNLRRANASATSTLSIYFTSGAATFCAPPWSE